VTLTLTLTRPPPWSSGQSSWLQNGDVLCFLWGTNWIYICYVEGSRSPLWSSGQSSWLQNGDVLCFLWGTNWIYVCYVEESRPPLWSSGQFLAADPKVQVWFPVLPDFLKSSGSGSGSTQPHDCNWGVTWKKCSSSGLGIREYDSRDPSHWPHLHLSSNLALSSPTSGGRLAGTVCSRTQATEFSLVFRCADWCKTYNGHFCPKVNISMLHSNYIKHSYITVHHKSSYWIFCNFSLSRWIGPLNSLLQPCVFNIREHHNSGHYPSPCLLFKTWHFENWILCGSSGGSYSSGPNR
jgi:hypothetical protein